ncbi:hypothetical protein AR457_33755 [Streptomyces agglomeratus]|uniref:hypothetical protein n=1 Tax=Streptomyces agglomeratus TaxID=285458 RepID=UPI00085271C9|nr:hypothetical protein [Streptomyces agglomeratus]OEJ36192.1 hypothetical protein BGK70_31405 [Streptomyces agglomeratus]OEJ37253.1 hypothetical protein BGK70_02920 [Streptomyces agglomeratus]OEJ48368.1 hypothetical protein AR457_33755 [Streptomyces agglomeratus]OEJ57115.1 hypothetical protein BGM19_03045 [Streptomyces agglomeratus]
MPRPTTRDPADTPAVALNPTAVVLGVLAVVGSWTPALAFAVLAGPLAVIAGVAGIHYVHHGTGRLRTAITGTILGAAGFGSSITVGVLSF